MAGRAVREQGTGVEFRRVQKPRCQVASDRTCSAGSAMSMRMDEDWQMDDCLLLNPNT